METAVRKVFNVTTGQVTDDTSPAPVAPAPYSNFSYNELVDRETYRRLGLPFMFQGNLFARDPVSLQRITGAGALAGFAILAGKQVGDYYWSDPVVPFGWIAEDNTIVQMDAQTMFAFAKAAADRESFIIFRGRYLKDNPIPASQITLPQTWD